MRFTILTFIILATAQYLNAQDSAKYLKLKSSYKYKVGYIITLDSSRIEGLIKDNQMNEAKMFLYITFVSKDGTKSKYFPKEIREFGYLRNKFVSDSSSFYKIIKTGKRVYLYINMSMNMGSVAGAPGTQAVAYSTTKETYYVKKVKELTFKQVKRRRFDEEFAEYFSDCESLKLKIMNKELTYKNIEEIVRQYNWCE